MKPTFLITSGPTREFIDPVRFISNSSSGKMGKALAEAAVSKGYRVTLISGPSELSYKPGIKVINVISALEMFERFKKNFNKSDIIVGAAAVADYRPVKTSKTKIKKTGKLLKLELIRNPDILKYAGNHKGSKVLAGFALESSDLIRLARKKLKDKDLDLIAANSPKYIGKAESEVWIINGSGRINKIKGTKNFIARKIINETLKTWQTLKGREKRG